ncbi:MAG: hypothetical protein JST89_24320 [Cyanobacteria bacterium SZAS-4]|nr:hypothetical protein [Cyanobacteria bacterium SZAS-4]
METANASTTSSADSKLQRIWSQEFNAAAIRNQPLSELVALTMTLWSRAGLNYMKSYGAPTKAAAQLSQDGSEDAQIANACTVVGYMTSLFVVAEAAITPTNLEELQRALAQLVELGAAQFALFKRCAIKLPAKDKLEQIQPFVTFADIPVGDCWSYGLVQFERALHNWGFNTDVRNAWVTRDRMEICVGIYLVR